MTARSVSYDSFREHWTVVATICSDGHALTPMLIFTGENEGQAPPRGLVDRFVGHTLAAEFKFQEQWITTAKKAYNTGVLSVRWFKEVCNLF